MIRLYSTLLLISICTYVHSQNAYFVDGYHGGIYGHYPVAWKTRFISNMLVKHPQWKICLEIEPETWDSVMVRTPADYQKFSTIVSDKRVEFTNPSYAQPYCYNVSGESIIRQFEYGIKKIHQHFPSVEFTTYSVEEPCFTSSLPQILKQFGFKYAVLKCPNTCWGGYMAAHGGELVDWVGPDGSSILTVPRYGCEELEKKSVWQTTAWGNSTEYLNACSLYGIKSPVGMCFQDAGWKGGPWLGSGDHVKNRSTYVTWREYFDTIADKTTATQYKLSQEDIHVSLVWGSQVLQKIAQQVREAENHIIMAEKIAVIANISNGYRYTKENIDEAWRTLMLAQHHDSWIVPYNRLNSHRTWAQEIALWTSNTNYRCNDIIADAHNSFGVLETQMANEGYVRIYNTLGSARKETVSFVLPEYFKSANVELYDANNKKIHSFADVSKDGVRLTIDAAVAPMGYSTYRIVTCKSTATTEIDRETTSNEYVIENDMYRVVVDATKGGTIKSLIAKTEGSKEFVSKDSQYALGELRGFFYDDNKFCSSVESPAQVTVKSDNPFEKSLIISGEIASHPFTQTITIRKANRKIDFDLKIDWKGDVGIGEFRQGNAFDKNHRACYDDRFKLNVLFPVNLDSPVLYKDAPFDVCESELKDTHFKTWDSIKHNIILNWVDLAEQRNGDGFTLLSDHTTSYSYGADLPLGLTAQFSGAGLWGFNYNISTPLHMKFAVIPHSGRWDKANIQEESQRWNEPLVCKFHSAIALENSSLIDLTNTGYQISAAHLSDKGIVVRLFNASGDNSPVMMKLNFAVSNVYETDLNGNITDNKKIYKRGGLNRIKVSMPRFGLRTFLLSK